MNPKENIDYVAQWFRIYRSLGESPDIIFKYKKNTFPSQYSGKVLNLSEFESFSFPHEMGDGTSALLAWSRSMNIEATNLKIDQFRRKPNFFRYIFAIFEFLWLTRSRKKKLWQKKSPLQGASVSLGSWNYTHSNLSQAEIEKSWNAALFSALDQVVRSYLNPQCRELRWWIPVNMRNNFSIKNNEPIEFNFVSNFTLCSKPNMTIEKARKLIHEGLSRQRHWATWWWQQMGRWAPESWIYKIAQNGLDQVQYAGAFSNLGQWKCSAKDLQLHFIVNNLRSHPIGAGAIWWNEQINLSLNFHPSLGISPTKADEMMQAWLDKIKATF